MQHNEETLIHILR